MTKPRVLAKAAQDLLEAPQAQRLSYIRGDRWVDYPRAQQVLTEMQELIEYPDVQRPPNIILVSETDNGKSAILKRLSQLNPVIDHPALGQAVRPVVMINAPAKPSEERLYNHLLREIGAVYRVNAPVDQKLFLLRDHLQRTGAKVLIIDEANNAELASLTQQRAMFTAIKELGNSLQRPIILAGVYQALNVLGADDQLQNRFKPVFLPRWGLDDEYVRFLARLETTLPLKSPSDLASNELTPLLHELTNGSLGDLCKLIKTAAERAGSCLEL